MDTLDFKRYWITPKFKHRWLTIIVRWPSTWLRHTTHLKFNPYRGWVYLVDLPYPWVETHGYGDDRCSVFVNAEPG